MVTEGGRLRRRSPACTSGAAAEAQERRLRWGGSGAEAPLALRVFGGRSTACAAGGLGRRSTACPAEGGSGAGAPLALRGGSGAGIPLVLRRDGSGAGTSLARRRGGSSAGISPALRRDDTSQEPRLRPEGGGRAYEAGLRSGGWGAGAPLLLRELLGSRCWAAVSPAVSDYRCRPGPRCGRQGCSAVRRRLPPRPLRAATPAQGVRLVTRTRPTPPPPHPHPAPARRTPTAAPAPAPPSSAVPGSGGRGLRR